MNKRFFGTLPSGEAVHTYTIENDNASLTVMDRGATIVSFRVFGTEIVGGFDSIDGYLEDTSHQGATIGRVANRIEDATFTMDGAIYMLTANNGCHCLHGGDGFDYRMWTVEDANGDSILLSYLSKDGEEGFPNELKCTVKFTLSGIELIIDYDAIPSGKTPVVMTNHAYFNLDGFGGTILDHTARIYADTYTEVNESLIPNGDHPNVKGTAFDFTEPRKIGERVGSDFEGYDHNFVLAPTSFAKYSGKELGLAAEVDNGRLKMSVYTDQPGVQFYIANFLGDNKPLFKGGIKAIKHGAFCLEAQNEPNCINHGIGFYEAGEHYTQTTVYKIEKL